MEILCLHFWKSFCSPNPDVAALIVTSAGIAVGQVAFGISPVFDRVYLFDIQVLPAYWRRGYASATIAHLVEKFRMPLTPVSPPDVSQRFWKKLRKTARAAAMLTSDLRRDTVDDEQSRWAHLRPEIARLEKTIAARIKGHERWEFATSRGLEDWPSLPS